MAPTNRARKLDREVVGPHVKSAALWTPQASYSSRRLALADLGVRLRKREP
jgi:hypothetical protein